jgi:hypothetical protein
MIVMCSIISKLRCRKNPGGIVRILLNKYKARPVRKEPIELRLACGCTYSTCRMQQNRFLLAGPSHAYSGKSMPKPSQLQMSSMPP